MQCRLRAASLAKLHKLNPKHPAHSERFRDLTGDVTTRGTVSPVVYLLKYQEMGIHTFQPIYDLFKFRASGYIPHQNTEGIDLS